LLTGCTLRPLGVPIQGCLLGLACLRRRVDNTEVPVTEITAMDHAVGARNRKVAHGIRITNSGTEVRKWLDPAWSFMTYESSPIWRDQCTYWHLLKELEQRS
jgi:hypothetical protein